jgi:hypothetical protein
MSQLMSQPSQNLQSRSSCVSGKKSYQAESEALQFEITNRQRYPEAERQYPYLCEDCGSHHLSAMPTGDKTRSRVNYEEAAK